MHIVITGGGGFIGRKLALRLLERGLAGSAVERLTLFDVVAAEGVPDDRRLRVVSGDIGDAGQVRDLIGPGVDGVFHLAAIVSGNAEEDFDLGMRVNLDGTRHVLEACRALGTGPRLVFTSSVAVFGGEMPEVIEDHTIDTPQTSYGAEKAAGELLVADYARKGFLEGRSLRLPTIVIRPGRPNKAASTFASSILREPLAGEEATCPVERDAAMYILSPRRVVDALVHAFELPQESFRGFRGLTLPGITATVGEMVDALGRVAGERAVARIRFEPDPRIQAIVAGWPSRVDAARARGLGFRADEDMDAIVRAHVEDELGGRIA
jgi:D-erythronate 2-dehydrogenase